MDFKQVVLEQFNNNENLNTLNNVENLLVLNQDLTKGDVSLPCFVFAKELKKNPVVIASEIANELKNSNVFDSVEAINGYVNFTLKKQEVVKKVLEEVEKQNNEYGKNKNHNGEVAFVDHCSANLAKYLHIGHLGTTVIGAVIRNILEANGYKVFGINYLGDYGTPFGKMITAIKRWGNFEELRKYKGEEAVDKIQSYYVLFNQKVDEDESLIEEARSWFYKIENKDKEATEIFNWIITETKTEVERICKILNISFDSWRGENYYSDKMEPVIKELNEKGLLKTSEGAKIVDLNEYGLGVCLIQKSDGTSLYATRDLAAVEDRYNTYKFDKGIYVTSVQQKLHFAQWFKVCELLGKPYAKGLEHVYYGQYSLPSGKIGSRFGKQALVKDMIIAVQEKAKEIMLARGTKVEDIEETSLKIATSALCFGVIKNEKIKDSVFDMEASLSFEGETAPYMQYTFARTNSVIKNCESLNVNIDFDINSITNDDSYSIVKLINSYPTIVKLSLDKYEPCVIVRFLLDLCSAFNKFYNSQRIIDNGTVDVAKYKLTKAVNQVLLNGFKILNINAIEKM